MSKFIKLIGDGFCPYDYGSNLNLKHASPDKAYVKRLAKCKTYSTIKEIYLGVKNPIHHDLVTLWKLGLVDRYTLPKYYKTEFQDGIEYHYATRIWWKTTRKGNALLKRLGL